MKKSVLFVLLSPLLGCAPAYVVPQNTSTAIVNVDHVGQHPSSSTIDVFSAPKCEKQFFLGELADVGTNIDLKKSATGKIEANKVAYFSGTRHWAIPEAGLEKWCSLMFSFTPKQDAVYSVNVTGSGYSACSVEVFENGSKEKPSDLQIYPLDRICLGDSIHYEK